MSNVRSEDGFDDDNDDDNGEESSIDPAIQRAIALLRAGVPVALPTETVYGLAADARNPAAVAEIYRIKGRPDFNPLIVHIAALAQAYEIAIFDARAEALAIAFWPGALTMVLPLRENSGVAAAVTAGRSSIALRCPAHPLMQQILHQSGLALAAPSANISGAISPSRAEHVAASLGDRVAMILDGGQCEKGLESSIVALTDQGWQMLRPGPITSDQIAAILGEPPIAHQAGGGPITAPGQLASHYAPSKPLRLNATVAASNEYHIGFGAVSGDDNLSTKGDLAEAAANLYAALHRGDRSGKAAIAIAPVPLSAMGAAINDRLNRAAADKKG